jgi:hypothetical protein
MFLPGRSVDDEKATRQAFYKQIEEWCTSLIESEIVRQSCLITVQEVICGDPQCAPIDTIVSISFESYVFVPFLSFVRLKVFFLFGSCRLSQCIYLHK